jgi:hypothetical protein
VGDAACRPYRLICKWLPMWAYCCNKIGLMHFHLCWLIYTCVMRPLPDSPSLPHICTATPSDHPVPAYLHTCLLLSFSSLQGARGRGWGSVLGLPHPGPYLFQKCNSSSERPVFNRSRLWVLVRRRVVLVDFSFQLTCIYCRTLRSCTAPTVLAGFQKIKLSSI